MAVVREIKIRAQRARHTGGYKTFKRSTGYRFKEATIVSSTTNVPYL